MGNKKGITLEEALKILEAANSIIQSQQKEISDQQLKIDAQSSVIHSKDLQIKQQEVKLKQSQNEIRQKQLEIEEKKLEILQLQEKLATQLRYRFCAHSEKADEQPSLFDFEDESYIPSEEDIEATVAGEGPYNEQVVKAYKRRKCGRKKLSYEKLYPDDLIIHVACMAHVRRKFFDATKCGQGFAKDSEKALAYIQKVYFLENRLGELNLSDDELIAQRKLKILPVLNEFHDWMVSVQPVVVPELKLGRAINYALNSWQHILNYIECPYVWISSPGGPKLTDTRKVSV